MIIDIPASPIVRAQIQHPPGKSHPANATRIQATRTAVVTLYAGKEIGSGSLLSREGLVITSYHVVRGVMDSGEKSGWLSVKTLNGNRYPGQVVNVDRHHDLALVQLNAWKYFPTVPLARPETIWVGQQVFAIGSPFGRPGVLSEGTLNRIRSNGDLQSQVVLHPGNSGGPLINSAGELLGINRGILQTLTGSNTGTSFATPVSIVRTFVQQTWADAS